MTRLLFKHSNIITASKHNKPHLYFSFSPVLHNLQRHRYFATRLANSSSMDTTKCANRKCSALHDAKPFKPTLCTECQAAHVAKKELEKNSQQMSKKTLPIENNQHGRFAILQWNSNAKCEKLRTCMSHMRKINPNL